MALQVCNRANRRILCRQYNLQSYTWNLNLASVDDKYSYTHCRMPITPVIIFLVGSLIFLMSLILNSLLHVALRSA